MGRWISEFCGGRGKRDWSRFSVHDLREFTRDKHRTVDDRPFGGGEGMVLKPEPIFECIEKLNVPPREGRVLRRRAGIGDSAFRAGRRLDQALGQELAALDRIVLICGRYEGVDERVSEHLADREISIGDYVLSGGELGAAVIVDDVTRLIPGAVGNEASTRQESFTAARSRNRWRRAEFDLRFGRIAGLSALHASRGVSRHGGAGSAGERQP